MRGYGVPHCKTRAQRKAWKASQYNRLAVQYRRKIMDSLSARSLATITWIYPARMNVAAALIVLQCHSDHMAPCKRRALWRAIQRFDRERPLLEAACRLRSRKSLGNWIGGDDINVVRVVGTPPSYYEHRATQTQTVRSNCVACEVEATNLANA